MSAEFTRNMWIEASPTRLAAATLLVGGLFGLILAFNDPGMRQEISDAGSWVALLALTFWGSRRVADSVASEWAAGTWDQQVMAGQGAGSLVLGKLFGAPALAWWIAILCFGALFLVDGEGAPSTVSRLVAAGLVAQSLALVLTLAVHRGMGGRFRGEVTAVQLAALGSALLLLGFLTLVDEAGPNGGTVLTAARVGFYVLAATQSWWGQGVAPESVALALIASVVLWSMIGAWRLVRAERGQQDLPWAWLAFLLFLMGAVGGFVDAPWEALVPLLVLLLALYGAALVEPKGWLRLEAWRDAWRQREIGRAFALTPLWIWAFLALAIVAAAAASGSYGVPDFPYLPLAAALFALRDVALLQLFTLNGRRSGLLFALLTVFLLYGFGAVLAGADLPPYLLWPFADRAVDLVAPALQALAALVALASLQRRAARRAAQAH